MALDLLSKICILPVLNMVEYLVLIHMTHHGTVVYYCLILLFVMIVCILQALNLHLPLPSLPLG